MVKNICYLFIRYLFSPVGVNGNLSLLDIFSIFFGGTEANGA